MTENITVMTATDTITLRDETDTITLREGYDAMRFFLERVWRPLGMTDEEIALMLGVLKWADGAPVDPTMWEDWLVAVQVARSGPTP